MTKISWPYTKRVFLQIRRRTGMRGSRRLREGSVVRIPVGLLLKVLRRGTEEEKGTLLNWLTPDGM